MNDRKMLLAAIRENPDEDTPRLAFADWLDERGDAFFADWADLIRTQIEFARAERFSPRWVELARRQAALFDKRKKDWNPIWNSRLGVSAFRRGFKEAHQFIPLENFVKTADLLFAGNPIRGVRLLGLRSAGKQAATAIVRYPGMERVETLDVGNNSDSPTYKFLRLLAPRMPKLRALGLSQGLVPTPQAAGDLLAALALPNLEALDLHFNTTMFQADGHAGRPESLFHSPALAKLRWLDLARTLITRDGVRALAHSPVVRGLRYLNLEGNQYVEVGWIGPEGAEDLAAGPAVRGVEFLNLGGQRIGDRGLAALLGSPLLESVRELNLDENDLTDEGVRLLAESPRVAGLRKLGLAGNAIGEEGAEAILASPHLAGLRILNHAAHDPASAVSRRLRERFPNPGPRYSNILTAEFFEPAP